MITPPLSLIKSFSSLYILHLSSGRAQVYLSTSKGASLVESPSGVQQAVDLVLIANRAPKVPWVILVDQSEETFWGGVMPIMRGAAKKAWIDRMSAQSGSDSPYHWSEVQGKSRSQPDKLRVLGYTLGRPEGLTAWLDALFNNQSSIRGVYSPVMLTPSALQLLKVKPKKGTDNLTVLVSPHAEGLRQTVLVEGSIRFSRLALHPASNSPQWFDIVYQETARLREYLVSSGLLKSDRASMQLFVTQPPLAGAEPVQNTNRPHTKDQYQWVNSPLADLLYVAALAKHQPLVQLAPQHYSKQDSSVRLSHLVYAACAVVAAGIILYLAVGLAQLWQKQVDIEAARAATTTATQQYQAIAKNFPPTPLTAVQLTDMSGRWEKIKASAPPAMRELLVMAGQTLMRHPGMAIESIEWGSEIPAPRPHANQSPQGGGQGTAKDKKDLATLVLGGTIRGIASDDLRGTRDALSKLALDFNRNPNLRAEVTKKPLDLSANTSLSGSGQQSLSELHFEIKLWQR